MSWRGAIEFGGFPINVKLSSRVRVTRVPSFRNLGPDGLPRVSKSFVASTGEEITDDSQKLKGVAMGGDEFLVLTDEAIEMIKSAEKDVVIKPRQFVPLASIDLALAIRSYKVLPDEKVPASEGPVNLIWNGLVDTGLAYVSQVALRGGSMDSILIVYATDEDAPQGAGLWAVAYPFADELFEVGECELAEDEKARSLFAQFVDANYATELGESFDHVQYASTFKQRRDEAIQAVIDGVEIERPEAPPASEEPSLMAVLEAGLKESTKAKAKSTAKKRPAAKKSAKSKAKAKA